MIVNNDDSCGKANAINHPHYRTCSYMGVLNHPKDMVECVYGIWVNPTVWDFSWYEWYVDNGAKHCLYIYLYIISWYIMDHHDRGDVALAIGFRLIQHLSCLCGRHVGPSCRGQWTCLYDCGKTVACLYPGKSRTRSRRAKTLSFHGRVPRKKNNEQQQP